MNVATLWYIFSCWKFGTLWGPFCVPWSNYSRLVLLIAILFKFMKHCWTVVLVSLHDIWIKYPDKGNMKKKGLTTKFQVIVHHRKMVKGACHITSVIKKRKLWMCVQCTTLVSTSVAQLPYPWEMCPSSSSNIIKTIFHRPVPRSSPRQF